jgi:hypothetical protein
MALLKGCLKNNFWTVLCLLIVTSKEAFAFLPSSLSSHLLMRRSLRSFDSVSTGGLRAPPPPQPTLQKEETSELKSSSSSGVLTDDGIAWDLGSNKMLRVKTYKGKVLVDIREFCEY